MANNTILTFKCLNPDCGKIIKLNRPAKSGVYAVMCPYCNVKKRIRVKGLDVMAGFASGQPQAAQLQAAVPDNSGKSAILLSEDFIVNTLYKVHCPHCNIQELGFNAKKPGRKGLVCPHCKGKIAVDVRKKTEVVTVTGTIQRYKGKLVLLRRGWLNKDYHLSLGKNTVGRYDEAEMSDISLKNDPAMSRRSIEIEVVQTDKGYTFKLKILKATNPVLLNGKPLTKGEIISLNFGDYITLGATRLRFDKDV